MKIPYINNISIQQKQIKDGVDQKQKIDSQKPATKAKTDSSDIERSDSFDDNRLAIAKSALLFDVSVKESDRISELKEAIQNGSYHVPADILADALLK